MTLPLRMMDFHTLSRDFWSRGKTVNPVRVFPPRPIEKNIEDMTLDDLIVTQPMEPLSESRRSWLATGAGIASLDLRKEHEEGKLGSIADSVADDSALWDFDAIDHDEDPDDVERDALRSRFTPYTTVDPNTQRQIEWEQTIAQCSAINHLKVVATPEGRLSFALGNARYSRAFDTKEAFMAAAKRFRDHLFGAYGTVDTMNALQERITLVAEAMDDMGTPPILAPDYVEARNAYFDEDTTGDFDDPDTRARHSSSPIELGFDMMSDTMLDNLLGVTEWTASGYPVELTNQADDE